MCHAEQEKAFDRVPKKVVEWAMRKKDKKSWPVNYRPVSLTSNPCRVMEYYIVHSIWSRLNKHSIVAS